MTPQFARWKEKTFISRTTRNNSALVTEGAALSWMATGKIAAKCSDRTPRITGSKVGLNRQSLRKPLLGLIRVFGNRGMAS